MDVSLTSAVYNRVQTNPVALLGYGMKYKGILLIPCRSKEIYLLQNVQTISGAHSVFCADGIMSTFSTVKTTRA